jgi:hypothetical protein
MTRQEHWRFEELLDRHDEQCDIDAARAVRSSPRSTTAARAAISIAPRNVSTSIARPPFSLYFAAIPTMTAQWRPCPADR